MEYSLFLTLAARLLLATHPSAPAAPLSASVVIDSVDVKTKPLNMDDAKKCGIVFKKLRDMQLNRRLGAIATANHIDTTFQGQSTADGMKTMASIMALPELQPAFKDVDLTPAEFIWMLVRTQAALAIAQEPATVSANDIQMANTSGLPLSDADIKFAQDHATELKELFNGPSLFP